MNTAKRAYNIVTSNRYLNLSTCASGVPWVAAVAYSVTSDFELVFYSAVGSRHIIEALNSNCVAINIYDSSLSSDDVDGLQATATCKQVSDAQLEQIVPAYYKFSFPDKETRGRWERSASSFSGDARQKFFTLSIRELYVIDLENTEVDGRVAVDLSAVRHLYAP